MTSLTVHFNQRNANSYKLLGKLISTRTLGLSYFERIATKNKNR